MEPIIAVVGFLGAGKTTLLRHLIQSFTSKDWHPFVILNDYENASLDAQQFTQQLETNSIRPLTGSCICCSGIVELRNIVNRIPERTRGVTLIEANGTSDACALMEFLGVGLQERFAPPIQISVVDLKNWQKRQEHNDLESNQILVSSLLVLTHLDKVTENRKGQVMDALRKLNPLAKISTMEELDVLGLTSLLPSTNPAQKLDHQKAHWASCSIDLPILPNKKCISTICQALPKSLLRVKGCAKIGSAITYTFFEHTPDGEVCIRPFNGVPVTGTKLLVIGPGSEPLLLKNALKIALEEKK